jgi:hypothetical protein
LITRIFKLDHYFGYPTIKGERMKKIYGLMLFWIVLISAGWAVNSQAMSFEPVTGFDSTWTTETSGTGTSTLTTDGVKVNLSAQGSATDYGEKDIYATGTTGVIGMMATLQVDQSASANNGCMVDIHQNVGQADNYKIQILISLKRINGQNQVWWRHKATNLTTNATVTLAQGTVTIFSQGALVDPNGGWATGKGVTVALARVGSEFWMYVEGCPGLMKIQALNNMTSYSGQPSVGVWADKGSSISGSASNVYLIKE